ncbi:N-acetylmuramidase domain-containing protein [Mesorhizobium sp. M1403]
MSRTVSTATCPTPSERQPYGRAGVCEWGEKPKPRDSYPRLKAACVIDETAALKSASWGLGQFSVRISRLRGTTRAERGVRHDGG